MKTILCYGDSNTWGYAPDGRGRLPRDIRWPGALQALLGESYYIIEEGLNGRATVMDDPVEPGRNGLTYLLPCLQTHAPLDMVVIMLGTNDVKIRFSLTARDVAIGAGKLVDAVNKSGTGPGGKAPLILLVSPAPLKELPNEIWAETFAGGKEKTEKFSRYYRQVAKEMGCLYLNGSEVFESSTTDGLHLDAEGHASLAHAVARIIRESL